MFKKNLPEKASIYAFIHLKLIGNLQGFNLSVIYKGIIASHLVFCLILHINHAKVLGAFHSLLRRLEAFMPISQRQHCMQSAFEDDTYRVRVIF